MKSCGGVRCQERRRLGIQRGVSGCAKAEYRSSGNSESTAVFDSKLGDTSEFRTKLRPPETGLPLLRQRAMRAYVVDRLHGQVAAAVTTWLIWNYALAVHPGPNMAERLNDQARLYAPSG